MKKAKTIAFIIFSLFIVFFITRDEIPSEPDMSLESPEFLKLTENIYLKSGSKKIQENIKYLNQLFDDIKFTDSSWQLYVTSFLEDNQMNLGRMRNSTNFFNTRLKKKYKNSILLSDSCLKQMDSIYIDFQKAIKSNDESLLEGIKIKLKEVTANVNLLMKALSDESQH